MHRDPGRTQIHHHFRGPNCETATLSASADCVRSCRFWSVKVSVSGSSLLNQVSLGVGWNC